MLFSTWILASRQWHRVDHLYQYQDEGNSPNYPHLLHWISRPRWNKYISQSELCENRGRRPGLPVPNSPYRHSGRKATFKQKSSKLRSKLQALVYDIVPSTTAVFSYALGSRKLSANEQFSVGAQTVVSVLHYNWNKTRRVIYSRQQSLHQHK